MEKKVAALNDFIEQQATPEDSATLKSLLADGASPAWLVRLTEELKAGRSLEEARKAAPSPSDQLKALATELRFEGDRFVVGDGVKGWSYTVDRIDPETGQTIVALGQGNEAWKMSVSVGEETMTITPDPVFLQKTGLGGDAPLPPALKTLVLVRAVD